MKAGWTYVKSFDVDNFPALSPLQCLSHRSSHHANTVLPAAEALLASQFPGLGYFCSWKDPEPQKPRVTPGTTLSNGDYHVKYQSGALGSVVIPIAE